MATAIATGCHGLFIRTNLQDGVTIETASFRIETDVVAAERARLVAAAEAMRADLEALFPGGRDAAREPKRRIIAFARSEDFRRYLSAHFLGSESAVGFYCSFGEECAFAWRDPPGPEDVRVLRHELVHQHLARRLRTEVPAWLEEGLAERLALGLPLGTDGGGIEAVEGFEGRSWPPRVSATPRFRGELLWAFPAALAPVPADSPPRALRARHPASPAAARKCGPGAWAAYRARRLAADTIYAALEIHGEGVRSWPGREDDSARLVPPPSWAAGEDGYVYHFLFVRFLEEAEGGRYRSALRRCLARAVAGDDAELDLSESFATLGELEVAFHTYIVREAVGALGRRPVLPE